MTETAEATGPMAFAASFPPEERYAATAAEIAARLAVAAGCVAQAAEEIRGAVDRAFREALTSAGAARSVIDLSLRTTNGAFDADVACGGAAVCHCSKPRSA
jgi:hypothetical protein